MLTALRAEFRKLLTIRATYGLIIGSLLLILFFAGFISGFKAQPVQLQNDPLLLADISSNSIIFAGLILAFAGLLLVGNEYRYNTIMYSLTGSNKRYKVLFAKVIAASVFALVLSLIVTFFAPFCTIAGAWLQGTHVGPQQFDCWAILWRCLFCGWGYAMYALILVAIMRNQIGAIVTFLLTPLIAEGILSLWLKNNTKYLPFNSLQSIATPPAFTQGSPLTTPSVSHAVFTVLAYVAVGLIVATVLFQKRDAN